MTGLIFLTIILLFFRIFFMLLTSYLKILLLILFSPLFMLFNAIPGKKAFSYWFKNLIAELMSFPIVAIVLIIGNIIISKITAGDIVGATTGYDIQTFTRFWSPPFLYGINQYAYSFLIGMGLLFLIPELVKLSKELLGVKAGLPVSIGLGTFFAGAGAGVGGAMGIIGKYSSIALAFPNIRNIAPEKSFLGKIMGSKRETEPTPNPQGAAGEERR